MLTTEQWKRFKSKIEPDPNSDRLLWMGSTSKGYGNFWFDGKLWKTHRLAYQLIHGDLPKGKILHHICNCKRCLNVEHLVLATQRFNIQDAVATGRLVIPKGSDSPAAKLSPKQVAEIRHLKMGCPSIPNRMFCYRYGVSRSTISRVVNHVTY